MSYSKSFQIGQSTISPDSQTYFIADVAANHDGELQRAKDLIWSAKEAGADCAKFQHYVANRIVSDVGFANGVGQVSHTGRMGKAGRSDLRSIPYKARMDAGTGRYLQASRYRIHDHAI